MSPDLEQKIVEEFPWMKGSDDPDTSYNPYDVYYCEHGDGWYELIRGACTDITAAYGVKGISVDVIPAQIKEKYGTLRLYLDCDNPDMRREVQSIIRKWEDESCSVCESCGADGTLRTNRSWIQTLCDTCDKRF